MNQARRFHRTYAGGKRLFVFVAVALAGLGGCVSPTVISDRQLARQIPAADSAYQDLRPDNVAAYNRALSAIALEMDRISPGEFRIRLAALGVTLDLPAMPLPLVRLHAVQQVPTYVADSAIGAAMIVEYDTSLAPLYPPEGLLMPATLVYTRIEERPHMVVIQAERRAMVNDADFPLSVDFSAPGLMTARRARRLARSGFSSMVRPAHIVRNPQIYLIDPYDPGRIPILMVHGLSSSPVAFVDLVNALRSDPVVSRHYQIWHFHYANGLPVMANAFVLREILARTIREVDPLDHDRATREIVVLGHSMGGVISHTLVSSSGDQLWSSLFKVPPGELQGDRETIKGLHRIMRFERNPRVVRAIFMSSPHRGSPVSDSWLGALANFMSRVPAFLETGLNDLARSNPGAMTPEGAAFYDGERFTAVRTLSARSPTLMALARLPIEVPFHTIVGQHRPGPRELGSDGVVPYASSHLDGAASELVVKSGHRTFKDPDAIREVIRILRLALPEEEDD